MKELNLAPNAIYCNIYVTVLVISLLKHACLDSSTASAW